MITQRIVLEVKDILSPTQACRYLGISRMTLWRWVRAGKISALKLNHDYFHLGELERVKANMVNERRTRRAVGGSREGATSLIKEAKHD